MKIQPVKIANRFVGNGYPCYTIAEIGSNFDQSLKKAKKLIKLAKDSGADAAKFQTFVAEKIISKKGFEKKLAFQSRWKKSVWNIYKDAEFPIDWHKELHGYAKKIGIDFFSTPYFFDAVDFLIKLKAPTIKIGSGDITHLEFLKYVGKTGKPILLATGASTLKEVAQAVNTIKSTGNNKIVLMQSITQYPSPIEQANLKVLGAFRNKFKLNVGYSDHSPGDLVILGSVALGACVIEKHFTIDPNSKGPDHPHSMDPESFKQMVTKIRLLEKAMGSTLKKVQPCEKETRIIQRRGIWTIRNIVKGEKFNKKNIMALRPSIGLSASEFRKLIGKKAKRNFRVFEFLTNKDL